MSKNAISVAWEACNLLATQVWNAYVTGEGIQEAKHNQQLLRKWVEYARENNIVYNGCYDEYIELNLDII